MNAPHVCALALVAALFANTHSFAAPAAQELLAEAQAAHRRGEITTAKAKFESVLKLEPTNRIARATLHMIKTNEGPGDQAKHLARLTIPSFNCRDTPLSVALDYLKLKVANLPEGQQAMNFVLRVPEQTKTAPVTLELKNVPVTEVLRQIGLMRGVRFKYESYAISVLPEDTNVTGVEQQAQ